MKQKIIYFYLVLLIAALGYADDWDRRDEWQQPEKVMEVIGVKEGMVIGIAGAGRGYFSFKMAPRVGPTGHIFANEINEQKLNYIKKKCRREKIQNITTILGEVKDPLFPKGKMDMVFMCYVFHHLEKPVEFMINIKPSLKPKANVVILEQDPEKTGSYHFLETEVVKERIKAAGYKIIKIETFLSKDNIFICRPDNRE
jgi:ubiquinone/menaquinone biosynthesis C-methylase UbiE